MAGFGEQGNEIKSSTKHEEFIIQLTDYQLLKNPVPWN
jgi:hypothetical protein